MGVTLKIFYLSHILEWCDAAPTLLIKLYCDNRKAVDFVTKKWIVKTPKWSDYHNVEIEILLSSLLEHHGGIL